jgi:divalent metal cation (Fe/Co/Zn/Cd) transporter
LAKFWLFFFYRKMSRYSRSTALKGSSMDSLSDCIATTLVLVSALIGKFFGVAIDGYAGLLVAGFIIFAGIKAAKETIDLLLGSPPDKEFVENIYKFTENYPSIVGIHDVMVHDYGVGRQIVSFHAEIPSDSDINIAHEEVDKLERDMHEKFGCIVTVHLDPIIVNDPTVNELRSVAENCAKEINPEFSIHDFRMTKGETSFNVIFDLVLPADCKMKEKDAENAVSEKIREKYPDCFCVIRAEHPFV